jgi:hypothetical protein
LAACSSGSNSGPDIGGWGGAAGSNGNGNGAGGPTDPTGGNAGSGSGSGGGGGATVNEDASTPAADAGRKTGEGGVVDAAPVEDTGSPANTFSLVNTNVTTIVYGETIYGFDPIANDSALDLSKVGTALSIRANTMPMIVNHVDFVMDGTYTHTENQVPYFLCGDNGNGTITNCIQYFTNGKHTLTITPYAASDAGADAGAMPSTTLYFSVSNGEAGAPDAGGGG